MYYLVLFCLIIGSIREISLKKIDRRLFILIYCVMTLMAIFRFGQLGDYFDYYYLYQYPITLRDPLFIAYAMAFRYIDASYQTFVTITELICFALSFPFFNKTCKGSITSLLIFYCYTYMVCPMSALRQAVCLSLLLYSYNLLVKKKKKLFYVIVGIGSLIHLSFISVLLLGWLYDKKLYNKSVVIIVVLFATLIMLFGVDFTGSLRGGLYMENRSVNGAASGAFDNLIQLALRLILLFPLLLFKPTYGSNGFYAKSICIIGFVLYCILSSNILIAGRIEYYYRTFLCLFVSEVLLGTSPKIESIRKVSPINSKKSYKIKPLTSLKKIVLCLIIITHITLYFKNISGFIAQGEYNDNVTVLNFPYISIFNKSDIDRYTSIDKYNYDE